MVEVLSTNWQFESIGNHRHYQNCVCTFGRYCAPSFNSSSSMKVLMLLVWINVSLLERPMRPSDIVCDRKRTLLLLEWKRELPRILLSIAFTVIDTGGCWYFTTMGSRFRLSFYSSSSSGGLVKALQVKMHDTTKEGPYIKLIGRKGFARRKSLMNNTPNRLNIVA